MSRVVTGATWSMLPLSVTVRGLSFPPPSSPGNTMSPPPQEASKPPRAKPAVRRDRERARVVGIENLLLPAVCSRTRGRDFPGRAGRRRQAGLGDDIARTPFHFL